jgi:hypothetical protein
MNSIRELFFHTPWWLLVAVFVAGVAVWWSGNNRQKQSLKTIGLFVLGFGIVWAVVGYFVDTPIEKVTKGTKAFVNAVIKRDKATLNNLLHPKATLYRWGRQDIIDGSVEYADRYGLKSAYITRDEVPQPPQAGMVTVTLGAISNHDSSTLPINTINSEWTVDWWETDDGRWLIHDIRASKVGNMNMEEINRQYFTGRAR